MLETKSRFDLSTYGVATRRRIAMWDLRDKLHDTYSEKAVEEAKEALEQAAKKIEEITKKLKK